MDKQGWWLDDGVLMQDVYYYFSIGEDSQKKKNNWRREIKEKGFEVVYTRLMSERLKQIKRQHVASWTRHEKCMNVT